MLLYIKQFCAYIHLARLFENADINWKRKGISKINHRNEYKSCAVSVKITTSKRLERKKYIDGNKYLSIQVFARKAELSSTVLVLGY